jgi:hypothetical protein
MPNPWPMEALFVPITVNRTRCCPLVSSRPLDTSIGPEGRAAGAGLTARRGFGGLWVNHSSLFLAGCTS